MVSWLHQQQIEKTWVDREAHDEGVVLKKCKGEYVCCPENLGDRSGEFCRAVEKLNVRASLLHYILSNAVVRFVLTIVVRHHHQHPCGQDILDGHDQGIRPIARRTTTSSTPGL
jgi:hypothetical protein